MKWDFVSIEDLVDDGLYISDGNYSAKYPRADEFVSKGIPFIRANNLSNHTVVWDDMRFITPEKHEILQKGHLRTNDVLITTRGNIGITGIVPADFEDANINAQLVLLRCEGNKIDPHYLIWVFSLPEIHEQLNNLTTGTALQQLPVGNLLKLKIPLPPLTEQKRIASLLAQADRLRTLRRTAHELGESLLQSVFLEMFGDVEINEKGWDQLPFDDVCTIGTEMVDPREEKYLDLPHIGGANIESVTGNLFDLKSAREDRLISSKFLVTPNHILFSKIRPKLRKVAYPKIHAVCSADIYPISVNSEICNIYYLLNYLRSDSFSKKVSELAETRTNIPKVNRDELSEQFIPVPPLSKQEEFAGVVARVESLRGRMSEAGRQVNGLFESLLVESFGGG